MTWGIRAQVLLALTLILGLGFVAFHVATADVAENAVLRERVERARQMVTLVRGRLADVPSRGYAMAEALTTMRALVSPDELWIVDDAGDLLVGRRGARERLRAMVSAERLETLVRGDKRHVIVRDGEQGARLIVVEALAHGPAAGPGPGGVRDSYLVLVSSLGATVTRIDAVRDVVWLFALVIIGLALCLGHIVLGAVIIRPLHRLVAWVSQLDRAQAARTPAGLVSAREVRELYEAFSALNQALTQERQRIQLQVSELKLANVEVAEAQHRLIVAEKLASVGKLAAGVAHEIGNPVAVLQGYVDLLQDPKLEDEERRSAMLQMEQAIDRISGIIRDLLDFARPREESERRADLVAVVEATVKLVKPQKRFRSLRVVLDMPSEPMHVTANPGRLEQILLNLLFNAAHASPDEGLISVRVFCGEDGWGYLEVLDEGAGVSPELQLRVFDPFYTTKEPGEGTGLGLAICYSIISNYGGRIALTSEEGQGTMVTVALPPVAEATQPA